MNFKEGEKVDGFCPKCGGDLFYEMSFEDRFSYSSGHYTVDVPVIACEKCSYIQVVEPEELK